MASLMCALYIESITHFKQFGVYKCLFIYITSVLCFISKQYFLSKKGQIRLRNQTTKPTKGQSAVKRHRVTENLKESFLYM